MKRKLIQDRKLSWSDVLKMMATRNCIMKHCIKQPLPFSLQAICSCVDLQSNMPGLRIKCTNNNVHLQSQTVKTSQVVHMTHWPSQKQKHFDPIFMMRVCFTITGQLWCNFFLQQKFQSVSISTLSSATAAQLGCIVPKRAVMSLLPSPSCQGWGQTYQPKPSSHAASHQVAAWVTRLHPMPAREACMVWGSPWITAARKNKPWKRCRIPGKELQSEFWYNRENKATFWIHLDVA